MKSGSLVVLLCLVGTWANASTEGKDYLVCKRLAVKYLERCLQDQSHEDADSCWSESKRVYQTCREDAIDQAHSTDAGTRPESSVLQPQSSQKSPASYSTPSQLEQEKISEVRKIRGMM